VILVVGEALVDLVIGLDGTVSAALGGAPYNAARAAARLGADITFAGGLSRDRFGTMLVDQLQDDGVQVPDATRTDRPTTLAAAELNAAGAATYRFYFDGTSAPELSLDCLGDTAGVDMAFTGGLGLVLHPLADVVVKMVAGLPATTLLLVDVNARPAVIRDRPAYIDTLRRVMARVDVVKVSDEDLEVLAPDFDVDSILAAGATAVIVTAGSSSTTVVHRSGVRSIAVPSPAAPIVDTIGAGDTFVGAFMACWSTTRLGRSDLAGPNGLEHVVRAVEMGHAAAGIVVTRHGADPPTQSDLP
jgi:fructokinase